MMQREVRLQDYIKVIMRRRWIIITFFTVLVTVVLIGSLKQTPIYEAIATIRIEYSSPQILSVKEVSPMGPGGYSRNYYETQYKLIKSPTLLNKVAQSLNFNSGNPANTDKTVKELSNSVQVRPVRNSQLVEISAEDPKPEMAAKIANAIAEEYIRQNLERNIEATSQAAEWLSKKIEEQRQKLNDSELALQRYREEHDINVLPQMTGDEAIENIKSEYAKFQALLANYSQRYTDEHPKMVELKAQIRSFKNKIQGLEDVKLGDKTMEYRVLEREVQTNKRMYEILLVRLKEIDLSGSLHVNNISITDRAEIPKRPVKPKVALNTLLAVIMGLVGGISLGFFVDYLDNTIKSSQDVKEILQLHFLGSIANLQQDDELKKDKIILLEPNSSVSESYRAIRTEIYRLITHGDYVKTILITSAEPRAGKTMTVSNLGIALAQRANRTLLVDSDLRKPQLNKIFNMKRDRGLSEYLLGEQDASSIIKNTDIDNLKVVTSGRIPYNSTEILIPGKIEEFIKNLADRFDFILFDSPPITSISDAVILADVVDGLIYVVRSGKSIVPINLGTKERLQNTKAKILGVVLNDVKAHHGDYYYHYYSKYYRYYGEDKERRYSKRRHPKENLENQVLVKEGEQR